MTALALPAVDVERNLKVAGIALAIREVVEGRAALLDRAREHFDNRAGKSVPPRPRNPARRAKGMDSGPKERFGDVDVADSNDIASVHQKRLDRSLASSGPTGEQLSREVARKRLDPQVCEVAIAIEPLGLDRKNQPETSRISKAQLERSSRACPWAEPEDYMLVRLRLRGFRRHGQPAAHPEVHHERVAAVEVGEQELGPAAQTQDSPARAVPVEQIRPNRLSQARIADLERAQSPAYEVRFQASLQHLDFGQFGHRRIVLGDGAVDSWIPIGENKA